jgi:membrane protein YqaA with SNARE-associated domain
MNEWIAYLLTLLSLPEYGLSTVFVVSFISATLLPLGSEPVVFGLVQLRPDLFWPVVLVATLGNTLGGGVSWWMGWATHKAMGQYDKSSHHVRALDWLTKIGP